MASIITDQMSYRLFSEINLEDCFFDSLKSDYVEFPHWFSKKASEGARAYIHYNDDNKIDGFLYLKEETEELTGFTAMQGYSCDAETRLKIGTFKINSHGTRLGERFVKKIFDHAITNKYPTIYVTIFAKHEGLIRLLTKYGFELGGTKQTPNGIENVYFKFLNKNSDDIVKNYPRMDLSRSNALMLAIWPSYHSYLFPDSLLKTESASILHDISHTNSIHKIYLSAAFNLMSARKGDVIVIYRTGESGKRAEYSAVATSICIVEEVKNINEFKSLDDFLNYTKSYSIFSQWELEKFWREKKYPYIVRFMYNAALPKRIIRKILIEEAGISREARIVCMPLTTNQLSRIIKLGQLDESFIIN